MSDFFKNNHNINQKIGHFKGYSKHLLTKKGKDILFALFSYKLHAN